MCPECEEPLVAFELEGIEIDHCVACGGTWLDAGELQSIAELAGAEPGGLTKTLEEARDVVVKHGEKRERRCPRCRRKLRAIAVGEGKPVEIDRCPLGHGLWFDRGEMKAAIGSLHDGEEGAVAAFFSELYQSEMESEPKGG